MPEPSLRSGSNPHQLPAMLTVGIGEDKGIYQQKASSDSNTGKRLPTHHSGVGAEAKKVALGGNVAKAKEKLNSAGKLYVAQNLWSSLVSMYSPGSIVSLTAKEVGMMKSLLKTLAEESIPPGDFLEFVVVNWGSLRKKLAWPDNPKKFRLGENPFFQELAMNKQDLVRLWNHSTSVTENKKQVEYTYTRVEDIPKNHPRYKQLVMQVEVTGKAVTTIKGD
jgi:hypothetical protein